MSGRSLLAGLALAIAMGAAGVVGPDRATAQPSGGLAAIPADKDSDLRLFEADGTVLSGPDAMARMQSDADLLLWLAGNQFFAMEDVIHAFQRRNPDTVVGLVTLPPGLLLEAIRAGGWTYGGTEYRGRPDVYASVNLGHLQSLKAIGLMETYAIYMHNELQIMVAEGNPKGVGGIADLARPDIRTSMPNPINEGIMKFYARPVLVRHGLWDHFAAGQECFSCQTTANNWFTAVHHRETPERILAGTSDAGIVWKTEVLAAIRDGAAVEGVVLPPADSLREEVSYAIGALTGSPRAEAASAFLAFLATPEGQGAYSAYGFVEATPDELRLKPIP